MDTKTLPIRLRADLVKEVRKLRKATGRTAQSIFNEAVARYLLAQKGGGK